MNIICEKCQSKFRIADEKIPAGKTASFPCPKCKAKISVSGKANDESREEPVHDGFDFYESDESGYDPDEKSFAFVEEEGDTVLICEEDPLIKQKISKVLDLMEYSITDAANSRDALTKLRYHTYNLVITNERFDTSNPDANTVLTFLERLAMSSRRNTSIILLSSRFRTMDNIMALQKSVNCIINIKDISNIDKILSKALTENEFFFRVYNEVLKEAGRV